jgi:hypothetical protein
VGWLRKERKGSIRDVSQTFGRAKHANNQRSGRLLIIEMVAAMTMKHYCPARDFIVLDIQNIRDEGITDVAAN